MAEAKKPANPNVAAAADFETAIDAAGFGFFNILLILAALPAGMATHFETSTMSYILPSAECDLKLTLLDKGILNAITYAGMISSAILWGYVADTKGRKKLLTYGYFCDVLVVMGGVCSQSRIQLMVFKFLGGIIMGGPFAVLLSYLTELHGKKYRALVMMLLGIIFSMATLALPVIAILVLPQQWSLNFFGLKFASWQIFLALCGIPSAVAGTLISFFPESPKFLMSQQRNAEALLVFQRIYAINHRKPKETFPIKELAFEVRETDLKKQGATVATVELNKNWESQKPKLSLREGFQQLRPLFTKPYLGLSLQVYLMNFAVLLGQNTMRLWLPQLFASIEEYEQNFNEDVPSICSILEYSVNKTNNLIAQNAAGDNTCVVVTSVASYSNNIIVGLAAFLGYLFAGFVINRIGSKNILTIAAALGGTCAVLMYWSNSTFSTLIISSTFVTVGELSSMSILTSTLSLFPTSLRTMIVCLAMMIGRSGSIVGNVLFPALMKMGCIPPFIMIGFVMYCASIMSAFLPNTIKTELK